MRSKEDNINLLITYRGNLWQQHKNPKIAKAIDETIDYIEELEEENRFLRGENNIYRNETVSKSVIRDKIKEIESNGIWVTEDYYFNEELGDEYPICQTKFDKEEMEDIVKDILKEILGE